MFSDVGTAEKLFETRLLNGAFRRNLKDVLEVGAAETLKKIIYMIIIISNCPPACGGGGHGPSSPSPVEPPLCIISKGNNNEK